MTDTVFPGSIDPALIQDSNYRFDPADRQYIDKQILALEAYALSHFVPPTGTGFVTVTIGAFDPAATANIRYTGGKFQTDGNLQWRNTGDSNRTGDLVWTPATSAKTITLPNATGTVVLKDTTDTLTNKTLVSPTITGTPIYLGVRDTVKSIVTEVQTAAVTQVNCGTYTLADETSVAIQVIVTCRRRTANTKRGCWSFTAFVSRTGGGVAVLDNLVVGNSFSLTAGTVTCDVDGVDDFRVRITPADTDGRNWGSEIRVQDGTAA